MSKQTSPVPRLDEIREIDRPRCSSIMSLVYALFCFLVVFNFFFFNDTATTEIYTPSNTLSLHDALPINICSYHLQEAGASPVQEIAYAMSNAIDRKSTRLNSSHCLVARMPSSA
jgi:hypothetical protein